MDLQISFQFNISNNVNIKLSSVADPDPGSGAILTPGFRIQYRFFPDPGSQTHIFENLLTILVLKFYNSLKIGPNFFLQEFKTVIICNFVKLVAT